MSPSTSEKERIVSEARPVAASAVGPASMDRAGQPAVSVEALSKRFPIRRSWLALMRHPFGTGYTPVVTDVSFEVPTGEFFGLLGPNGAGKTTVFRMIAAGVIPDSGSVRVHGYDVVHQPQQVRRQVGCVLGDERSLQWRLSAFENLLLFSALHGLHGAAARQRIAELLDLVGLGDRGISLVNTFSSGMKQRLLIARALLSRPRVLLLDEPTRSLDPISARDFRRFLRKEIAQREGCTVILATHSSEEAFELCDRVAVLHKGRLLAVGKASELRHQYAESRYEVWTSEPDHAAFSDLEEKGKLRDRRRAETEGGWTRLSFELSGDLGEAARIVDILTCSGVRIARFERVPVSLADLLERIVASAEHPTGN